MEKPSRPHFVAWLLFLPLFILAGFYLLLQSTNQRKQSVDTQTSRTEDAFLIHRDGSSTQPAKDGTDNLLLPSPIGPFVQSSGFPTVSPTLERRTAPELVSGCGWPPERVLIISIDALRPEAINTTGDTPFISKLALGGAHTWHAQTTWPSITLTGHASMLSGYDVSSHKVDVNSLWKTPEAKISVPTIFQRAHEKGLITVLIAAKPHFGYIEQDKFLNYHRIDGGANSAQIAAQAAEYIGQHDFNLMFVHFADTDKAGHAYGWMSPEYLSAVSKIDRAMRKVFQALADENRLATTLVIINSDHGGSGKSHGAAGNPLNRTIPWIISGPCVKARYSIIGRVNVFDTAATALWALGIELPGNMEGIPVWEAFKTIPANLYATTPAVEK